MPDPRPNVLIFCVDQMRADHMACDGNRLIHTPNLDRLAARGTVFRRSYCNNPICMPARASMFTGLLPRDHGVRINGQNLRRDLPTLPGILAEAGYRTHACGKLHLSAWVPKQHPPQPEIYPECLEDWRTGLRSRFPDNYYGFHGVDFVGGHTAYAYGPYHSWLRERGGDAALLTEEQALPPAVGAPQCYHMAMPVELHYNRFIADAAMRVIAASAKIGTPPFFTWCSFPDPHHPMAPPAPFCHMYDPSCMPPPARRDDETQDLPPWYKEICAGRLTPNGTVSHLPLSPADWQEMRALTYGMISHVDMEIGRVLDALDDSGQADNTIIVFLSDHGDMMGDHGLIWKGFYTFRGCIRIPTIVAAPDTPGGQVSDALIGQIDLMPSILELCGIPMPGADWVARETPFARGAVMPLHPYPGVSWRRLLDDGAGQIRDTVVIENDDPATGFRVRCLISERHRLTVYPGFDHGELFDLHDDPDELHNLWYKPTHAAIRAELTARLLDAYSRATPLYPIPPWNS